MKKIVVVIICLFVVSASVWHSEALSDSENYWAQWRGPDATGVAPHGDPPVEWSESKNVRWKIEIPGKGHASPVVWEDKIFVLTAIETDKVVEQEAAGGDAPERQGRMGRMSKKTDKVHKFDVLAINRQDGSILWQKTVSEELPHEGTHNEGSWASSSPITDGERVYAFFGSRGLYCFDMQGNLLWEKDLGDMTIKMSFGEGSSPVLHGDKLVVNWDHEGQSFIVAFDKKTGEELWKVDRNEATSWATPLVVEHNGRTQVITSATKLIRSYDLATGELIWESGGMTMNAIPNPVYANGIVYIMSGFRGNALLAINLDRASGDITDSEAIVWRYDERETPYAPSPLLYGDTLYFLRQNGGFLSCFDAATGQAHYTGQKLEGIRKTYVSPVGASERVYITGQGGVTVVIKRGSEFKVLATNSLDDSFTASPAIVDKEIYLRGHKHLYRISSD